MTSILVIEDDELTAEVLASFLDCEGYKVHIATSAEAALAKTAEVQQDVTISDWRIAGSEGSESLLTEIRSQLPKMHLILVTGAEADEIEGQIEKLDVSKVFVKPVDLEQVVEYVKSLPIEALD